MTVFQALQLMIGFGTFILAFITLVVHIIVHINKKK